MSEQEMLRCTFMRTGTSKSVYFKANELPADPVLRDKVILAALGSPDIRQTDGLGGGDVSTSKVAIISRSDREDADVDYTFGQVSLHSPFVDYSGNCGNCSSGVGPFAIDEGMVKITEPVTVVRVYNTNTKKVLVESVRVMDGKAAVEGDFVIDGVPGSSSRIDIDFRNVVGSTTGKLLPTGNVRDVLTVKELGEVPVSILDVGNPVVFFHATAVGALGTESRPEINANAELLKKIEAVRGAAAEKIGLVKPVEVAQKVSPMRPLAVFVNTAVDYPDYVTGATIKAADIDFIARNLMNQAAIETFAATAAICTAIASVIDGTVVNAVSSGKGLQSTCVRFGHPRGISETDLAVAKVNGEYIVNKAIMTRTARRIMDGYVYIRKALLK